MIESEKVEAFAAHCDNCKTKFEQDDVYLDIVYFDKSGIESDLEGSDWHISEDGNACYCPDCYYFDEEDNLIIKTKETL